MDRFSGSFEWVPPLSPRTCSGVQRSRARAVTVALDPGFVPLLSGLTLADRAHGPVIRGFPTHRSGRGSDCGTLAPPVRIPRCHPGLVPGSRLSGTALARLSPDRCPGRAWTPEQVRGDKRRAETVPFVGIETVSKLNRTAMDQVRGDNRGDEEGRCGRSAFRPRIGPAAGRVSRPSPARRSAGLKSSGINCLARTGRDRRPPAPPCRERRCHAARYRIRLPEKQPS